MRCRIYLLCSSAMSSWTLAVFLTALLFSPAAFAGTLAEYRYDAVGNIIAIERSGTALSLSSFSPTSGPVGEEVAIHGSGFNSGLAGNTVSFNGTVASVLSASPTTLIVRIPLGATTGIVTVTVNGNTVNSQESFTVSEKTMTR